MNGLQSTYIIIKKELTMQMKSILHIMPMQLLKFLNLPDVLSLEKSCHEIKRLVFPHRSNITFYGLSLPDKTKKDTIFYYLFYSQYDRLHQSLVEREDEQLGKRSRISYPVLYRPNSIFYKLWEDMTLLEIAYLLRDDRAISILLDNNRTICHSMRSYTSEFGSKALINAIDQGDTLVFYSIWEKIHVSNQDYFKERYPYISNYLSTFCE